MDPEGEARMVEDSLQDIGVDVADGMLNTVIVDVVHLGAGEAVVRGTRIRTIRETVVA